MESYGFILDIALILLSTKLLGLFTQRMKMPQVVGALIAGLILGPACLGIVEKTEFLTEIAELGVIVLMFCAGLETNTKELAKCGKAAFIIALCGVVVPLLGGMGIAYIFNRPGMVADDPNVAGSIMLQNIFIGVILTATSVSITVQTLKEMGKLSSKAGNAILGAAIIDDILGIIALTIITSFADPSVDIIRQILLIVAFFAFAILVGALVAIFFKKWVDSAPKQLHRHTIIAFSICLIVSYAAEKWFGVADITGAYVMGLVMSNMMRSHYIESKFDTLSYLLLSPVFFASIGLGVVLPKMSPAIILFAVSLTIVAVLTKIVGCGLSAKACGYKNRASLQIGVGMISRGEVALIVANKGIAVHLMNMNFFGPIVIVVVITTIITPILLKIVFKKMDAEEEVSPA